jgi:uncharacterized membrane protein
MDSIQQILYVVLLALAPISECRGSIIYGFLAGMNIWVVFFASLFGNIIFIPFVLLLMGKVNSWILGMKDTNRLKKYYVRYIVYIRSKYKSQIDKYGYWGLAIFVAVPIPFTGAWTGCILAYLLGMDFKKAFASIALGVLGAAIIVTAVVWGFGYLF